jgi:hypothetical protein
MRYRLRTLMIVLALGPPVLAWSWIAGHSALATYLTNRPPKIKGGEIRVVQISRPLVVERTGTVLIPD